MNKPTTGIAVDAWCENNPGRGGYRGIDLSTSKVLFIRELDWTTNNIAEFMATAHASMWLQKHNKRTFIWSDSTTAISWYNNKKAKTKMNLNKFTLLKSKLEKCEKHLQETSPPEVRKWNTKQWGEIPADFGRK